MRQGMPPRSARELPHSYSTETSTVSTNMKNSSSMLLQFRSDLRRVAPLATGSGFWPARVPSVCGRSASSGAVQGRK